MTTDKPLTRDDVLAMPAGPEMDALVAERVMGVTVVGTAACWMPDGGWSVYGNAGKAGDACEVRPVRVSPFGCHCEVAKRFEWDGNEWVASAGGHHRACLAMVPHYSTDIADAWQVVEKYQDRETGGWMGIYPSIPPLKSRVEVCRPHGFDAGELPDVATMGGVLSVRAGAIPLAICRAVLLVTL